MTVRKTGSFGAATTRPLGPSSSASSTPTQGGGVSLGRDQAAVSGPASASTSGLSPSQAVVQLQRIQAALKTAASTTDVQTQLAQANQLALQLQSQGPPDSLKNVLDQAQQLSFQLTKALSAASTLHNLDDNLNSGDGPTIAAAIGQWRKDPQIQDQAMADLAPLSGSPFFQNASSQADDIRSQLLGYSPPSQPGSPTYQYDRTISSTAPASNDESDSNRIAAANTTLAENSALEKQALAKLSPADRARYQHVVAALANHPEAHLVIQDWLIQSTLGHPGNPPPNPTLARELANGRPSLTGSPKGSDGQDLLAQLDSVADPSRALAKGVDRGSLVSCLVREAANPCAIQQDQKNTCGPTSLSLLLDRENPAEYARLVAGMATPSGKVALANGDEIQRTGDWAATNDGGRSVTLRLLQPALENYANWGEYSNTKDTSTMHGLIPVGTGTLDPGWQRLQTGLFNKQFDDVIAIDNPDKDSLIDEIAQQANSGHPVPVAIDDSGKGNPMSGGHYVIVTGIKNGQVQIANPWGTNDSISIADFKKRLFSASLEPNDNPFDPMNGSRLLGNGFSTLWQGLEGFNPLQIATGIEDVLGGVAGELTDGFGKLANSAGNSAISWASGEWNHGGIAGKPLAVLGWTGGGIAKGAGDVVQGAGSAASWAMDKATGLVNDASNTLTHGAADVGNALNPTNW